ncbi:MAG: TIGR03118 family protein [Puia sp.]
MGLAWAPSGIAWVNSMSGHVSELYTGEGAIVRAPVNIPSPTDTIGGLPTGIIFAGGAGFTLANNAAPNFLFVGVDGVFSGWNGAAGNNALRIADNSATSAYTGLTLATWNGSHLLYAANFRAGKIDVWDTTFSPVSLPFHDPGMPSGYSPFNIQSVGNWLFVTYAKPAPDGRSQAGAGLGLVDVFNPDGSFVRRFASRGTLNAPWGVVMTPENFLQSPDMSNDDSQKDGNSGHGDKDDLDQPPVILIGNFGDGRINVFSTQVSLWGNYNLITGPFISMAFGLCLLLPLHQPSIRKDSISLQGPADETDGLFGYLIKN